MMCIREPATSIPASTSYQSIALAYTPRSIGKALKASSDTLPRTRKFAKVPFIIGDQEDEGTIFSLAQNNITTTSQLVDYILIVNDASRARNYKLWEIASLIIQPPDHRFIRGY